MASFAAGLLSSAEWKRRRRRDPTKEKALLVSPREKKSEDKEVKK